MFFHHCEGFFFLYAEFLIDFVKTTRLFSPKALMRRGFITQMLDAEENLIRLLSKLCEK